MSHLIFNENFSRDHYDEFVGEGHPLSDDSDSDNDAPDTLKKGHPIETKEQVLKNLAADYPYNKGGPAQEYPWTEADIAEMTDLIKERHSNLQKKYQKKARQIRGQNYKGESTHNHLLNWVNSCRSGKRFPSNPNVQRGSPYSYGEKTNQQLWEYVSETLISEFHYWVDLDKKNRKLPKNQQQKMSYPKLDDLIFRHNDDFTGGHWSHFAKFWDPFIDEMRYFEHYL